MSDYGIINDYSSLTPQEKHAALVASVRRDYQRDNPGARLFPNQSGVAWQGEVEKDGRGIILRHIRPIFFGIPEPEKKKKAPKKSGGSDLLGETPRKIKYPATNEDEVDDFEFLPILTGIECKTGGGQLKPNQKKFREWMKAISAIYFVARECRECGGEGLSEHGRRMLEAGKMIKPERCHRCGGNGYTLEDK